MTDDERDTEPPREQHQDDLLAAQQGKGYGEDEGEREEALEEDEQ